MGLIKATMGAVGGVLADSWKEYFYCEALDSDILVAKGQHKTGKRSSNRKGDDNVITDGSQIAVADGQCMVIVEDGKVIEVCSEPGKFIYDFSSEPGLFTGDLKTAVKDTLANMYERFTFGGQAGKDQRIYYINTKELTGNKYGTPAPIPFRVVDRNIGLDIDIAIRCFGEYSYKIVNPILFYTNVCGNVDYQFNRNEIDSQLKSELMTALQPAFARISELGIRYSALPAHTMELANALNQVLSAKWGELRGIEIVSFGVSSVTANPEDEKMIKELQRNATFRNTNMAAAQLVGAQSQAMQDAAKNSNGAMMGFAGMNMANTAGGMNAQDLFNMNNKSTQSSNNPPVNKWTCSCGQQNTGNFCTNCGKPKPSKQVWTCECQTTNTGNFCTNCGKPKPKG